jgi:hypothetical protein
MVCRTLFFESAVFKHASPTGTCDLLLLQPLLLLLLLQTWYATSWRTLHASGA